MGRHRTWGKRRSSRGLYADDVFIGDVNLTEAAEYLKNNVREGGLYTIVLGSDDAANAVKLDYGKKQVRVTLTTSGGEHTVKFDRTNPTGPLFTVGADVTFTLEDGVTLSGIGAESRYSLVYIKEAGRKEAGRFAMSGGAISENTGGGVSVNMGSFAMSGGAISGNTGGGVSVNMGSFAMTGGAISGNTGGGVSVNMGSFAMSGGAISGNTGDSNGGGVSVDMGSFAMTGGAISGNTGGGVSVNMGSFAISGGTISRNTANGDGGGVSVEAGRSMMNRGTISGNVANGDGGGVYIYNSRPNASQNVNFRMNGGEISGNTANRNGGGVYISGACTFTKSGTAGIIYGSNGPEGKANMAKSNESGHAVFGDGDSQRIRNSTADETTALDKAKSRLEGGGWESPTDTPEASLAP